MKSLRMTASWASLLVAASCLLACAGIGPTTTEEHLDAQESSLESAGSTATISVIPSTASVDVQTSLGLLSSISVGANAAAWDSDLIDPALPRLLEDAGIQLMRYPGGSVADNYHWLTNTPDDPNLGGTDPNANFDAFMSVAARARAGAMITVNYG